MIIGKQSTLNDLGDLKTDLETKIEDAKKININEVSQIESGVITDSINVRRPNGMYFVSGEATGIPLAPAVYGWQTVTNFLDQSSAWHSVFCSANNDIVSSILHGSTVVFSATYLTTKNTITDANGFIKAA